MLQKASFHVRKLAFSFALIWLNVHPRDGGFSEPKVEAPESVCSRLGRLEAKIDLPHEEGDLHYKDNYADYTDQMVRYSLLHPRVA